MKSLKSVLSALFYVLTALFVFLVSLIGFASRWAFVTWGDIDMDEIVFHLQQPLQGTGDGMIGDYLLKGLLPSVLVLAAYLVVLILLKKRKRRLLYSCAFFAAGIAAAFLVRNMIWERLDMENWIAGRMSPSAFVEEHYADPKNVKVEFPEKKRNLIYLYLESAETTFADKENGGDFSFNAIPELTKIAQEGEDFSGKNEKLNGGIVLPGTGFTTGAIFAQTMGLPLKLSISGNFMDTQSSFFPDLQGLGDLLEREGYRQVFLLGSDATFGGRRLLFQDHGGFEIRDYLYAKEKGWIAPDYEVFWGYEDEKLFSFAKETVSELAKGKEPFALTMLTVDTHYEDGYTCRLCRNEFPNNPYANVFACSSRQIAAFLAWLKTQDFYENTTVVLCGDHTTMDTDFCADVESAYQRKVFTAFVNAEAACADPGKERTYSTMDLFPTTVAALGAKIPGERLGLGTNLFSARATLAEEYGVSGLKKELNRRSDFLEAMEKVNPDDNEALLARIHEVFEGTLSVEAYDPETKKMKILAENVNFFDKPVDESLLIDVKKAELAYQEEGSERIDTVRLTRKKGEDTILEGTIDLSSWKKPNGEVRLDLYTGDGTVYAAVERIPVVVDGTSGK